MDIVVSGDDIKEYEKLKVISLLYPLKEKIKFFENKYSCNFKDFEKNYKKSKEDFKAWDDYIEWKGYVDAHFDLEEKLREIDNASSFRIA